ncbi:MAG TPA: hypothetical protein PLZ62_01635, partial [bacterium]|nr:hypothetical protein [bacterium]
MHNKIDSIEQKAPVLDERIFSSTGLTELRQTTPIQKTLEKKTGNEYDLAFQKLGKMLNLPAETKDKIGSIQEEFMNTSNIKETINHSSQGKKLEQNLKQMLLDQTYSSPAKTESIEKKILSRVEWQKKVEVIRQNSKSMLKKNVSWVDKIEHPLIKKSIKFLAECRRDLTATVGGVLGGMSVATMLSPIPVVGPIIGGALGITAGVGLVSAGRKKIESHYNKATKTKEHIFTYLNNKYSDGKLNINKNSDWRRLIRQADNVDLAGCTVLIDEQNKNHSFTSNNPNDIKSLALFRAMCDQKFAKAKDKKIVMKKNAESNSLSLRADSEQTRQEIGNVYDQMMKDLNNQENREMRQEVVQGYKTTAKVGLIGGLAVLLGVCTSKIAQAANHSNIPTDIENNMNLLAKKYALTKQQVTDMHSYMQNHWADFTKNPHWADKVVHIYQHKGSLNGFLNNKDIDNFVDLLSTNPKESIKFAWQHNIDFDQATWKWLQEMAVGHKLAQINNINELVTNIANHGSDPNIQYFYQNIHLNPNSKPESIQKAVETLNQYLTKNDVNILHQGAQEINGTTINPTVTPTATSTVTKTVASTITPTPTQQTIKPSVIQMKPTTWSTPNEIVHQTPENGVVGWLKRSGWYIAGIAGLAGLVYGFRKPIAKIGKESAEKAKKIVDEKKRVGSHKPSWWGFWNNWSKKKDATGMKNLGEVTEP